MEDPALSANMPASAKGSTVSTSSSKTASSGLVDTAPLKVAPLSLFDTAHEEEGDNDVEEDDRKMPAVDKDRKLASTLSPQPTSKTLASSANIPASANGNMKRTLSSSEAAKTPHQGTASAAEVSPEEQPGPKKKMKQSDGLMAFFTKKN